tara:strand:- start:6551 stop:6727 length:177 start_codon:yes stop_codon:yes gene_type:complete
MGVRSKKDLVDAIFKKHTLRKTKIIGIAGMVHSSYRRVPSLEKKVNKPSLYMHHQATD